ncbi:saccharopine dehydrogenase family protein [Verrucomicrobiaceae bacterium N1E253]|uniref:Saccharopine dehydrogenase family protein n=1 Tax=Oceaniferula marina TaxID=2748318 RepID=A0A851G9S1_9BACT|nr:saccharopine dehydrogenase family protein [Oceaniferula marina]NWK54166.1 saccharopine dehydrogenase family protein [Oceaniferula marina]
MKSTLIIGAGGVGRVVTHKCAQLPETFGKITLASRTKSKCDCIAAEIDYPIDTVAIDADDVAATVALLNQIKPDILINVALPYQDLTLMEACLEAGVDYLDTANYEPKDDPRFSYEYQWPYHHRFVDAGLTALLGSGFDPGVTNVFCAYAQKHFFDEIHTVDIIDANAGDHGLPFATNFNPEINIREITAKGRYWQEGEWKETEPLEIHQAFDFPHPEVGTKDIYLLYHEEMESLCKNLNGVTRLRFWMTFSKNYINHLTVLQNVGMTSIEPVDFQGQQIAPLEFLKSVLPDPASLGPLTKGKTCIGCVIDGVKDGKRLQKYIYNVCDHQEAYAETQSQAISYTTGVPAMIGAKMILDGHWKKPGVNNMEQNDPDPFMEALNQYGLPWEVVDGAPFLEQLQKHNP